MLKKIWINEFLHLWLTVSSLVIAIIYFIVNPSLNILGLKDVVVFLILFFFLFFSKSIRLKPFLPILPLAGLLVISFVFSPAPAFAKVASLRQLIVPYVLIIISYLGVNSIESYKRLLKKISFNLWMLLIFGLVEVSIHIWNVIRLDNFFFAKNTPLDPDHNIPYVFIEPIAGGIVRMVSMLLDPINLGHTLVCLLCIIYISDQKNRFFKIFIVLIGIALTICKGAFLQLFLIFGLLNNRINKVVRIWFLVLLVVIGVFLSAYVGGILVHFTGFTSSFNDISLIGKGLATAGNQAVLFSDTLRGVGDDGIGDSFMGAIIGQIGVLGLFLWLFPLLYFVKDFEANDIFKRILIAQLLIAVFSENSFNLLSIYSVCMIIGAKISVDRIAKLSPANFANDVTPDDQPPAKANAIG